MAWRVVFCRTFARLPDVGAGVGKTKLVKNGGTSDTKNDIMLYSVVQARTRRRQNHS
jgi:hypothetical protein